MTMTKKYKILGKYIRDMSSETPDAETYIFVRDHISKYQLNIDINSKAVRDGIIEVNIILKFADQPEVLKKSHFEITYTSIVKVDEKVIAQNTKDRLPQLYDVNNKLNELYLTTFLQQQQLTINNQ